MAVKKASASDNLIAELTAPFEDDQKTDSNTVAPHHYLRRLLNTVPGLYSISQGNPVLIATKEAAAIAVVTNVTIEIDEVDRIYGGIGAKGLTDSEEDKDLANNIKSAASDSLKRALLQAGINLDTYENEDYQEEKPEPKPKRRAKPAPQEEPEDEDEDEDDEPPPRRRGAKPAAKSARGGKWDGTEKVGFGAHVDEAWEDLDGSYLAYCLDKFDDGPNLTKIKKEIARREDEGTYDPKQGQKKPAGGARRKSSRSGSY